MISSRTILLVLGLITVLIAVPLVYSTTKGYTIWWFGEAGNVTVDAAPNGFLHRSEKVNAIILTRTDTSPRQSYLIGLGKNRLVINCGGWSAPHFPIFAIGDVNPPCSVFTNDDNDSRSDRASNSTLFVRPNSVEFTTTSGKRIKASW
jgi:hypothetical protein